MFLVVIHNWQGSFIVIDNSSKYFQRNKRFAKLSAEVSGAHGVHGLIARPHAEQVFSPCFFINRYPFVFYAKARNWPYNFCCIQTTLPISADIRAFLLLYFELFYWMYFAFYMRNVWSVRLYSKAMFSGVMTRTRKCPVTGGCQGDSKVTKSCDAKKTCPTPGLVNFSLTNFNTSSSSCNMGVYETMTFRTISLFRCSKALLTKPTFLQTDDTSAVQTVTG